MKTYTRNSRCTPPVLQDPVTTAWIPELASNFDYRRVQEEVSAGTATIEEMPPPPVPEPVPTPRIATKMLTDKKDIVGNQTWDALGGVAVNAQFYVPDLTKALSIIEFSYKSRGGTAQLQLIEMSDDGSERPLSDVYCMADVAGWVVGKFMTNQVPSVGDQTYELRGRLNGAQSASIRYCSVVLLEMVG